MEPCARVLCCGCEGALCALPVPRTPEQLAVQRAGPVY
jgi:hypothetical protein